MLDFSFRSNRAITRVERAGRERVAERLKTRSRQSVDSLVARAGIPEAKGREVIEELARILGVSPGVLRAQDRLHELCRVSSAELPYVAAEDWEASGFSEQMVEIGGYDIIYLAETQTSKSAWKAYWDGLDPHPGSEEQWIDIFMGMRVDEFLRFTAGVTNAPSALVRDAL
jgi:hypothetical protein